MTDPAYAGTARSVGPLAGVRVLDFSMGVAGPHAGELCAQYGADVVKIESPQGDWSRVLGQQFGDFSAFSVVYNRGKRSLSIDLKQPRANEALRKMALGADVIIEAFRPGVMQRLGLDDETLRTHNPGLIYLSVSGFGPAGPMTHAPAVDAVMQAFTGFMYANADDAGKPQRVDFVVLDVVTGLYGFQAIAMALMARSRSGGQGRHIDCSLMSASLALQAGKIVENQVEPNDRAFYVPLGVFPTADGYISLSARRDDHFAALCDIIGHAEWVQGGKYTTGADRVRRREELVPMLNAEFLRFSTQDLSQRLTSRGIMNSRVNSYSDVVSHVQVEANAAITWQTHDGFGEALPIANAPGVNAGHFVPRAPAIGEHSLQVLSDWGIGAKAIEELLAEGSVVAPASFRDKHDQR